MPKEITHTLYFVLGASLLLLILWLKPDSAANHPEYLIVIDVSGKGLHFKSHSKPSLIDDARLKNLTPQQARELRQVFAGKWIKTPENFQEGQMLSLPLEASDPMCFSNDAAKLKGLRCPTLVLNP